MSAATRRDALATLAGFLAVPAIPAAAAAANSDAVLFAMEAEFLTLDAETEREREKIRALDRAVYERCGYSEADRPWEIPGLVKRINEARRDFDYAAAEANRDAAIMRAFEVADRLIETPATTLAGLRCKARVFQASGLEGCLTSAGEHFAANLLAMGDTA